MKQNLTVASARFPVASVMVRSYLNSVLFKTDRPVWDLILKSKACSRS